jgi:hypothetical protein
LILGGLGFIVGWNVFLIQRDAKLFKAYDACSHSIDYSNCPYKNK